MRNAHSKLFTPGPTEVRPEILQAMAAPQIYHRSPEFRELYAEIQPKLQKFLYTQQPVLLFASSSTGAMEAAVQNCVGKKCLNLVNGAFSMRWHEITAACGIPCETLEVPWNLAIKPQMVETKLRSGEFDAVTLVHNETSTGARTWVDDVRKAIDAARHPALLMVDAVSSLAADTSRMEEVSSSMDWLAASTTRAASPMRASACLA